MIGLFIFFCLLSVLVSVLTVSHSLLVLVTYFIEEETPFPEFSVTYILDDITVGHYNSETNRYISRGNTSEEDYVVHPIFSMIKDNLHPVVVGRLKFKKNQTENLQVYQVMSICELWDNDQPGQMITKSAFSGSTTDEHRFFENTLTCWSTQDLRKTYLEISKWSHEMYFYPACITTLKNYLKKRGTQVNRKVKPRVRLIQKLNSDCGGFRVICLATGFYPRHINLTLFRDGQPIADHEITGGDLLPNGDGTYQMRKSLEINRAAKYKYTCSATHLSLDNRMTVDLEYDHGEPFNSMIPPVLTVLALVLLFGAAVIIWRKCHADSSDREYSSASTSEETVDVSGNVQVHDI